MKKKEDRYEIYIREGDDQETAICKSTLDDNKIIYTDVSKLDCEECPCAEECYNNFMRMN